MDLNLRIDAANLLSTLNGSFTQSNTLCHSCGSAIRNIIPPAHGAERRTEEPIPERYTCFAIYLTGMEGIHLTLCQKCYENFEAIRGARRITELIVDERGDHDRLLACFECIPFNYSIGDGPENCTPYFVNIRCTEHQF